MLMKLFYLLLTTEGLQVSLCDCQKKILTAEPQQKLRKMISQGFKKDIKKAGFQQSHALKKALSEAKKVMAGQFIQFVRWESQQLLDVELSSESGGVSKNRTLEIAGFENNF
jgi:hypothetical protein